MPPVRLSTEKSDFQEYYGDVDSGLHVVDLEAVTIPPRYSRLSGQRQHGVGRLSRLETIQDRGESQQSSYPISPGQTSTILEPDRDFTNRRSLHQSYIPSERKRDSHISILDRKVFGWTWRRWAFIIGPCIAVVVMAIVLIVVFVTRSMAEANSTPTSPDTTQTSPSATPTSDPTIPSSGPTIPSSGPAMNLKGALNGTSIATADPVNGVDVIWVFYQNSDGVIVYVPLGNDGKWKDPVQVPITGTIANGTALTAFNYPTNRATKINLIYQDDTGNIRNMMYNNSAKIFAAGSFTYLTLPVPTDPNVIKRLSWVSDTVANHYLYYTGLDGLIHEWTYSIKSNTWQPAFTFPGSNGYSGASVFYDKDNSCTNMYLIDSKNNLQSWSRPYNVSLNGTEQEQWTKADTLPNSQTKLGFVLNRNATIAIEHGSGDRIYVQEERTNMMWYVQWNGVGEDQKLMAGRPTGAVVERDSSVAVQRISSFRGVKDQVHIFTQHKGNDIVHFVQGEDGAFKYVESLPV